MTKAEASALLSFHSYTHEDVDEPNMRCGFLAMLRPFKGELHEENFHELMKVLWTLKEELQSPAIDRKIMLDLFSICHYSRAWGLDPGGMLQRNNLLTIAQTDQLRNWTETISYCISCLLEGLEGEAFHGYAISD